jgi:hypothetical protein
MTADVFYSLVLGAAVIWCGVNAILLVRKGKRWKAKTMEVIHACPVNTKKNAGDAPAMDDFISDNIYERKKSIFHSENIFASVPISTHYFEHARRKTSPMSELESSVLDAAVKLSVRQVDRTMEKTEFLLGGEVLVESEQPTLYRLVRRSGELTLQGMFVQSSGNCVSYLWRDIPTVELP